MKRKLEEMFWLAAENGARVVVKALERVVRAVIVHRQKRLTRA